MALISKNRWNSDLWPERNSLWRDRFDRDWDDWPMDWPKPRTLAERFRQANGSDRWLSDWPRDWPQIDTVIPRFSSHLDRFDRNWRDDPFWQLYPRWAEPIFKEGLDVKTNIINDNRKFAVEIDSYQFRPEELQVKTLDDTLLIEGRHEDVRDSNNYTKMYFIRKYQLPADVDPRDINSSIDSHGRLTVEAPKRNISIDDRSRNIQIESGSSRRNGSRSNSSYSPRDRDYGRFSEANNYQQHSDSRNSGDIYPQQQHQQQQRDSSNFLSPNNYKNEYSSKQTDNNGVRHEAHREMFHEEFRRSGSQQSINSPIQYQQPQKQTNYSINNNNNNNNGGRVGTTDWPNNNLRRQSENLRIDTAINDGEHLLRPTDEELGRHANNNKDTSSRTESSRNVRIQRTYN